MPVRHDPLLTRALAARLRRRWRGRRALGLVTDPERRRGALRLEDSPALVLLLHPEHGHVLPRRRVFRGQEDRFRNLDLVAVSSPPDERLLRLDLGTDPDRPAFRLVVELHTNQWNLLLIRLPGREIERVLWPRRPGGRVLEPGVEYEPLSSDREGRDEPLGRERWRELLEPLPREERRGGALRRIAYLSALNVDWVLGEAAGPGPGVAGGGDAEGGPDTGGSGEHRTGGAAGSGDVLDRAYRRYRQLLELLGGDGAGGVRLLERPWGVQPYPHPLGREDAPRTEDLLEAMTEAARRDGVLEALEADGTASREATREPPDPDLVELEAALRDRIEALEARRESLRSELEEGPDPERLREAGSLLLARKDQVPRGEEQVHLEGFTGEERVIDLDPRLSPADNAGRYFERARRRERAGERIPDEIASVEEELSGLRSARREVAGVLESGGSDPEQERVEALWERLGGRPDEEEGREGEERKPYRVLETSGGLEVRVGKSARANEELTFHHSHTEDIWLHARQVAGSHVILRWGRKDENPPRDDLLEAAVAAAVNSKARHSGSVAVDWTRRKYVRSPRKSAPGAVIPQRHETMFVRPSQELVERMQARARSPGAAGTDGRG